MTRWLSYPRRRHRSSGHSRRSASHGDGRGGQPSAVSWPPSRTRRSSTRATSLGLGRATRSRRRRPLPGAPLYLPLLSPLSQIQSNDLCISFPTTSGPRSERTRRRRRSLSTWPQPSPRRGDVTAAGSSPVSTPSPPRSAGKGAVPHGGMLLARGAATPEQEQDRVCSSLDHVSTGKYIGLIQPSLKLHMHCSMRSEDQRPDIHH